MDGFYSIVLHGRGPCLNGMFDDADTLASELASSLNRRGHKIHRLDFGQCGQEQPIALLEPCQMEQPMDFSMALHLLRCGGLVCRPAWQEPGAWLQMAEAGECALRVGRHTNALEHNIIVKHTRTGCLVPWSPSMEDVLAHDWYQLQDQEHTGNRGAA